MVNKKTNVPFTGTKVQEDMLLNVINEHRGVKGSLISVLQKTQDIYGYLPLEVQKIISENTGIPLEEIYGVTSFYAQFSLNPKGKYTVSCCLGTACYVKGAGKFYEQISNELGISTGECTPDGKFSLEACRCIGACGLAPVMTVNDDIYGRLTSEEVEKILAKY
ncbi:MAG: NAD(P)H-dependent oxidoreductase subunit E [Oscillospiraceae bacterium]|jgi:NADP-reducing hydrogenase subunit HndA|nr:NAD(P)H-dependent oxidoreductase subunit E [Oscillospiraceae bacterium]